MGIYDREYYRREGPSFLGALTGSGKVCNWLIGINVAVFVLQVFTKQPADGGPVTAALALDVSKVLDGQVWRLLTYAFVHEPGGLLHIFFNMLFLWWFGGDMEDHYGPREFLTFYLVSAFAGGLAFLPWALRQAADVDAPLPVCLGASGAVTAVLVLYAFHYPTRLIYIMGILPVPIWLFVVFQVAQDAMVFVGGVRTTTAVTVHLGGAAFAFLYYQFHWRLYNLLPDLRAFWRQRSRPQLRVYREEPVERSVRAGRPAAPPSDADEHLEAKLDAVLEKVARHGQNSLTDSERQVLLRASEVYKKRRT
jgi:membrane associated rhomboid family serine protease